MVKKRKKNIVEVTYTYTGTDAQFSEFLKMMVHDYLAADDPHTNPPQSSVGNVESACA